MSEEICPITQNVIVSKLTLSCGHFFEQADILNWLTNNNNEDSTCPVCRAIIVFNKNKPQSKSDRIIQSLDIHEDIVNPFYNQNIHQLNIQNIQSISSDYAMNRGLAHTRRTLYEQGQDAFIRDMRLLNWKVLYVHAIDMHTHNIHRYDFS